MITIARVRDLERCAKLETWTKEWHDVGVELQGLFEQALGATDVSSPAKARGTKLGKPKGTKVKCAELGCARAS
jgi:hypothetical protein